MGSMCGVSVGGSEYAAVGRTNCHLYNYGNNNPLKYTDPEGRLVSSDNETQNSTILSDINRIAGNGFYFDNNNNLQIDKSAVPGENYSKEIRNELISLIEGKNKDIQVYIKYSYTYTDILPDDTEGKFNEVQGCPNLGKTAYGDPLGKTFRVAVPSNLGVNNNGERASIFVHEFMGHLVPTLYGKSGGNAVRDTMP